MRTDKYSGRAIDYIDNRYIAIAKPTAPQVDKWMSDVPDHIRWAYDNTYMSNIEEMYKLTMNNEGEQDVSH